MNETERLARELEKALFGGAWHGPSWSEVLAGVSGAEALHRPIPNAHTIAEIAAHATTWFDVVARRMNGDSPQVSDAEDWPKIAALTEGDWSLFRDRSLETARVLVETVRRISPERLHESRPGLTDTWFELVTGELQHVLYHAGQVGLLKKAAG
jgi:DinB family protein